MNKEEFYKNYSEIILKIGINLQENQKIYIVCNYGSYPMARYLAQQAYQLGAAYVHIDIRDNYITAERIKYQKDPKRLGYFPEFIEKVYEQAIAEHWAFIRFNDEDELTALEHCEIKQLNILSQARRKIEFKRLSAAADDLYPWLVVSCPTQNWANHVFGGQDPQNLDKLINLLASILRLDHKDPLASWKEHIQKLKDHAQKLNAMKIHRLHFQNEHTDLNVYLLPGSLWKSGGSVSAKGQAFVANIPTEEVFTTPDYRKTHGFVRVVKPVPVSGVMLEGIELRFENGKVVQAKAAKKQEILDNFLKTDEGSAFLGEVALVDFLSPICQAPVDSFGTILYDENASCHIALGNAYTTCVDGGTSIAKDQLLHEGINVSLNHLDFMISDNQTQVDAYTFAGEKIRIIEKGSFIV